MQGNVGRDTRPEVAFRRALYAVGFRYRKHNRPEPTLRVRADVVLVRARVCVFVDGCFWHGCPEHFRLPSKNAEWWRSKIDRTIARDRAQTDVLLSRGWTVIRVWEHVAVHEAVAAVGRVVLPRITYRAVRHRSAALGRTAMEVDSAEGC